MSTANDNRFDVTCEGNVCTTPEGDRFTYNPDANTVTVSNGEGNATLQVYPTPEGLDNAVNIGDYINGAHGYIDVPQD